MIKGRDINGRSRINIGTGRYEGQLGNLGFLEHSAIENRLQSFPLLFEYATDFGDANMSFGWSGLSRIPFLMKIGFLNRG